MTGVPPVPYLDDGDVRLYHGDAIETLATLPEGSVDCCITSPPSDADTVEILRPQVEGLALGQRFGGHLQPVDAGLPPSVLADGRFVAANVRLHARAVLAGPERQTVLGLGPLHAEERKERPDTFGGGLVRHLPGQEVSTVRSLRSRLPEVPAEALFEQLGDLRRDLLEPDTLRVDGRACVTPDALVVGAAPNPDGPIRVDRSGEVGEQFVRHVPQYTREGGRNYTGGGDDEWARF